MYSEVNMTIQIKNRWTGEVMAESKTQTLKDLASDFRANLSGTNLSGTNLSGAYLSGAKGIVSFIAGGELAVAFFHDGKTKLKIGCEVHTLKHWKSNYKKIGKSTAIQPHK
jgi:hypothetical protein